MRLLGTRSVLYNVFVMKFLGVSCKPQKDLSGYGGGHGLTYSKATTGNCLGGGPGDSARRITDLKQ